MLFALVILAGILLWKLKGVKMYNMLIFISLTSFWVVASAMSNNVIDKYQSDWVWPIAISMYQLTQAATRVPIGKLSQKLRSRKVPLIMATMVMLIGIVIVIGFPASNIALIIGMTLTGVYGATFGLQNQYWAENYNIKRVFTSITIVGLMPIIGEYISKAIYNTTHENLEWRWILLISFSSAFITILLYMFFLKERKETMRLDNMDERNKVVSHLGLKEVFKMSFGIVMAAFAFEMVRSTSIHEYFANTHPDGKDDASTMTIVISAITTIITIFISLYLIKKIPSKQIIIISQIILVLSLVFGLTLVLTNVKELLVWYSFIACVTVGYTLYSITMLGTMLHFDLKNKHLVLGIWLSFRSFGVGSGQLTSNEILVNSSEANVHNSLIIIFSIALVFACLTALRVVWTNRILNKEIFKMVDFYEYHKFQIINK